MQGNDIIVPEKCSIPEVDSVIKFRSYHTVQTRHSRLKIPKIWKIRRKCLYVLTTQKNLWPNIFPLRVYSGYIATTATISLNNIQVIHSRIKFGFALCIRSSHKSNLWNHIFAAISLSRLVWCELDCCFITLLNFIGGH